MKDTALIIIQKAFEGKFDKAGEPYINHLIRVSEMVPAIGVNQEVKVIALLHDLLEDCPEWNEKALKCFFTERVVEAVVALTRKHEQSYGDYITQVLEDGWAAYVKKADLEDNMDIKRLSTLTDEDLKRLRKYHAAYQRVLESFKR